MKTEIEGSFDTIVTNGIAITLDDDQTIIDDALIGIRNGRIAFLAPQSEKLDGVQADTVIDARGCVVVPGLINIHTHTMLSMLRGRAEDMGFAPAYTKGVPQGFHMSPDDAFAMAQLGALEALLFGSTFLWDTYVHAEMAIEAISEIGVRVATCSRIHDVDLTAVPNGIWENRPEIGESLLDETLRLADRFNGKTDDMIAVHLMPHAPDTCSTELLKAIGQAADRRDLLLHTHLCQSMTEVDFIRRRSDRTPVEFLDELGLLNERLTAAHCIFVSDSDIALMRRSGMTVAHIPKGNMTGGTRAPTHAMRKAGINIALGTDNMHGDMIECMRWALNVGRLQEGRVTDFWQPRHALHMATRAGARALRLDDTLGSIEVGKAADLVVVDFERPHLTPHLDPLGTLLHTAQGRDVRTVMVAGRIVVQDGHATLCDEEAIIRTAARVAKSLWEKAGR